MSQPDIQSIAIRDHNYLLKSWREPKTFVGTYENDGIKVISARIDDKGVLTEFWNYPTGIVIVKHQIHEDNATCTTFSSRLVPHDPMD